MSSDWTISTGLVHQLSRFTNYRIKEWLDRKEKFCLILIEPTDKLDINKTFNYKDIIYKENTLSMADLIIFLQNMANRNNTDLNDLGRTDLNGLKSKLSKHNLEELNPEWSQNYNYKVYFEGEWPSYPSPKINHPSWYIFYGLGNGHHYPSFESQLFDKDAPYYPSKISAISNLMDIDVNLHKINGYLFPGIIFLLPFTSMYIMNVKIVGKKIELEYTDSKMLNEYAVKIYYEGSNDFRDSIQEDAKFAYLLRNIPYRLSLMLYRKDTGQLIDSIHHPSNSDILYSSKRVQALTDYEYIASLIEQGESDTVELKGFQNYNDINSKKDDLIETVISFSNTFGGTIIIGVKDDKTIIGFKDLTPFEKVKKQIIDLIDGSTDPLIRYNIELIQTDTHEKLIIITVKRGDNPPYIKKNNGIFMRIDDRDRSCSRTELDQFYANGLGTLNNTFQKNNGN